MKCPICGCKMKHEIACPYCNITGDEVRFVSNVEAKKRIKAKEPKEVYNSTYIPYDINRRRLALVTILGGFFGLDLYYVGRYKYAILQLATIFVAFVCFILFKYLGYAFFEVPTEILTLVCAIFVLLWFTRIFNVLILKKATIPIVLPNKVELKDRIVARSEEEKLRKENKEKRKKSKYNKLVEKEKKR